MTKDKRLLPVRHCYVAQRLPNNQGRFGRVEGTFDLGDRVNVKVRWQGESHNSVVDMSALTCGFRPNMEVQDVPSSRTRQSLGEGVVVALRTLGEREQVLVDLYQTGIRAWVPYQNLRLIKGARHRFILGDTGIPGVADHAERFRLKALAHALEMWNENTGSLSHLDIDPLPHQIHLVHHILASGNLNWLIADDVGLGKTIETGMLLAALKQRGMLNRVLLVTPAGLTKQWQDELNNKFRMGDFQIFGEDFFINEPRHWKMYDYVIASIDRLKSPDQLELLKAAGDWDLVVFDEAHRLSRRQYGMKLDASQRFELAASLRNYTDSLILLSATPHQGMQDKFQALLELLRPERKEDIALLALNPEIIGEMVFRNNKSDVTDAEGNFIFKGKTTHALQVPVSQATKDFDQQLQDYLRRGYEAGAALGIRGNAIGFVMTVYRKLAASSIAAIHHALINRYNRLLNESNEHAFTMEPGESDQRFLGEWEEKLQTDAQEFFKGELELLGSLIDEAANIKRDDHKLQHFLDAVVQQLLDNNPEEKLLIFTEYRTTQQYLKDALETRFGTNTVSLIHGSMPHQERKQAISHFEETGRFLISTEAGGEGINLQRECYIMANYDLPWNPMRLVQRIGRLYRYGQQKHVLVFNIHSPDTADEQIMQLMYTRIDQVVNDMASVSPEFTDALKDDILGQVADLMDVQSILQDATMAGIERTQERIDDALRLAREAAEKQRELFEHAASFDPNATSRELSMSPEHLSAFVQGMFAILGVDIVERSHKDLLWHIRLPESLMAELDVKRSRWEVTLDRLLASNRPGTHMLDLDSFMMQFLLNRARSYDFLGLSAVINSDKLPQLALLASILRWQNDQGQRRRQEFTVYGVAPDGSVTLNPETFSEWLKQPAQTGALKPEREQNQRWFQAVEVAADQRLAELSNRNLHPENNQWVGGAWVARN